MEQNNLLEPIPAFSYEVFDRQLQNFCMMTEVMINGWNDYSTQEMVFDINSLYIKASRLCYMADQDLALQHADVTQQRKKENQYFHNLMEELVIRKLSQFVFLVINEFKEGKQLEGHDSPMFTSEISIIFPRLFDLFAMEGMSPEKMQELNQLIQCVETFLSSEVQLTQYPEVEFGEKLWNFLRLYAMSCYLLLHFRRVCHVTSKPLASDVVSRLTEMNVQKYMSEAESKHQIDLYLARLQYENDGKPLDEMQWLKARRELKSLVPEKLELTFLSYADNAGKVGAEIANIDFTPEEFMMLIDALAKYQVITHKLFELNHPEEQEHTLPNEAFNLVVKGRAVDLQELKKSIAKMAALVQRKNQWFCVWSVLKHLNLIREDCGFATFAHQMMSDEWLGKSGYVEFSADNLSDYSRYFNEYDFTEWDEEMFLEKKQLYGMTKWSPKLCQNFSSLCRKMMKSIWGYSFLG